MQRACGRRDLLGRIAFGLMDPHADTGRLERRARGIDRRMGCDRAHPLRDLDGSHGPDLARHHRTLHAYEHRLQLDASPREVHDVLHGARRVVGAVGCDEKCQHAP